MHIPPKFIIHRPVKIADNFKNSIRVAVENQVIPELQNGSMANPSCWIGTQSLAEFGILEQHLTGLPHSLGKSSCSRGIPFLKILSNVFDILASFRRDEQGKSHCVTFFLHSYSTSSAIPSQKPGVTRIGGPLASPSLTFFM